MRSSILFWSSASSALLALMIALVLLGVGVLLHALLPHTVGRLLERWRGVAFFILFVVLPLFGALAGYLEGRLKLR